MHRPFVVLVTVATLAAVTACGPDPLPEDHCSVPAAPDVDWHDCDLVRAHLGFDTLTHAGLTGANLTDADFSMDGTAPHLSGAHDPVDATGSPSNTTGVRYENTTCPDGTVVPPGTCW